MGGTKRGWAQKPNSIKEDIVVNNNQVCTAEMSELGRVLSQRKLQYRDPKYQAADMLVSGE